MKISLIIPSYNPALKLPQTLDALIVQSKLIDELIIVVDKKNYSNEVKSMLETYSSRFNLRILIQDISGRGRSRNKGAESSNGDILMFLDDDMLAEKDLIEKHIQYHSNNPGIIVSGNGYRKPEDSNYSFGDFLINMEKGWKESSLVAGDVTLDKFNFTACNMSLPKKIFEQLGGFDIQFTDSEDFDFAIRAYYKGIRIVYDRMVLAWHNDWPTLMNFVRRHNEYKKAKKDVFEKHPEYLENFKSLERRDLSFSKKILARLLKRPVTWFSTSHNFIFASLPLKLKFKIYRLTIAVNAYN